MARSMVKRIILICIILVVLVYPIGAITISQFHFETPSSNTVYYVDELTVSSIIVYSDTLYLDGNISVYPESGWVNMSLEDLNSANTFNFTNNVSISNITLTNGVGGFSVINTETYSIYSQTTDANFQDTTASSNQITFTNISSGSWYIQKQTGSGGSTGGGGGIGCSDGETKLYNCSNGVIVEECVCINGDWDCIDNPEDKCVALITQPGDYTSFLDKIVSMIKEELYGIVFGIVGIVTFILGYLGFRRGVF